VLAEQILNTLVGLVDTYLAGRISPAATSAIGLAAYVGWLASMLLMLIGTGTTALVSRYEGSGDHDRANHFANQSLTLASLLGVAVFCLMYALAPWFAKYCRMTGESFDITLLPASGCGRAHADGPTLVAAPPRVGNMRTPMMILWSSLRNVIPLAA
jgi:Na+-driven multidrug efflux pump